MTICKLFIYSVATHLEKSGNLILVRENSGQLWSACGVLPVAIVTK